MAKVFRIFRGFGGDKPDWFKSFELGAGAVDSIQVQETDGKKSPTSIPSPFAQIDLVRTAFKTVCDEFRKGAELDAKKGADVEANKEANLDDKKDSHRLVSNALDVGQIFFNIGKNASSVSIDVWDKKQEIKKLLHPKSNGSHKHLGRTLELFLDSSDAVSYNFNLLDKIFILKYNNKVIGGTSPKTLFFASPNALRAGVEIYCENDKMLDENPLALYKREKNYIKFLFYLKSQTDFASYFPEVNDYLDLTLEEIEKKDTIFGNSLREGNLDSTFVDLVLPQNPGVSVEVLPGFRLKKVMPSDPVDSGFMISTTKEIKRPPLVLPVETFTEKIKYIDTLWDSETKVPRFDKLPPEKRTLPRGHDYPYLTLADFLTEDILKLPYQIDGTKFHTGGFGSYLLPLTSRFFEYFTADELVEKNLISMKELAGGGIEVLLNIPIKDNRYIPYSKKYVYSDNLQLNSHETGRIIDVDFTLGIYPFVASSRVEVDYTIALAEKSTPKAIRRIDIVHSPSDSVREAIVRARSTIAEPYSTYYLTNENFDHIRIGTERVHNVFIPKFRKHVNTGLSYHFAIDFGTTNTHIEYNTNQNSLPNSFTSEEDSFVILRDQSIAIRGNTKTNSETCEQLLHQEVVHNRLGKDRYLFPFRSVLLENNTINYDTPTYLYSDVNIGFDYGLVGLKSHLNEVTDIKWLHFNENHNNERVEKFIQQLLTLCKNKVLMTNGNVEQTKITWLYPISMTFNQRSLFRQIWRSQYKKVFYTASDKNLDSLPESIAPFYFYTGFAGLMNQTMPTASIDVGGGTTDVTVFEQNEPKLISSFKFAGNAIFGDGYSNSIGSNGFVLRFYPIIKNKLQAYKDSTATNDQADSLLDILESIYRKQNSVDVSNFFFTLKDNYQLVREDMDIDYFSLLQNDQDTKLVFLLFYSALVYHLAQLMKFKEIAVPRNILFSGTASKSINLLDSGMTKVNQLFNEIFNGVYGQTNARIEVIINESPKVITAKGALKGILDKDVDNLIQSHVGTVDGAERQTIRYNQIDGLIIDQVIENVHIFFKLLDDVNAKMNFNKSFGISSSAYELFKDIRGENLKDYLLIGLKERKKDVDDTSSVIEETLFFYPLVGILNEYASKVITSKR